MEEILGTGRRKTAVASVRLRPGQGKIDINGRSLENYFVTVNQREVALSPLTKLNRTDAYDMLIRVKGGGPEGQAEAVRLGIARALISEEEGRKPELKQVGYLTRDPRKREREKYGQPGARKRFQFSKR